MYNRHVVNLYLVLQKHGLLPTVTLLCWQKKADLYKQVSTVWKSQLDPECGVRRVKSTRFGRKKACASLDTMFRRTQHERHRLFPLLLPFGCSLGSGGISEGRLPLLWHHGQQGQTRKALTPLKTDPTEADYSSPVSSYPPQPQPCKHFCFSKSSGGTSLVLLESQWMLKNVAR